MVEATYKGFGAMYLVCLRADVKEELERHPDLTERLGVFKGKFIQWCANQRLNYEADIYDEVKEFELEYINKRLYNKDLKLWSKLRKQVFERDKHICQYCGKLGGALEPDHIVPIVSGGTNEITNLTTACRTCNRQKKDKSVEEFLEWKRREGE